MTCSNIHEFYKIPSYYDKLRPKKFFLKTISEIEFSKRKIHLIYYKKANIPVCALPRINSVVISKNSFLSFCYSFYFFINSFTTRDISISPQNISLIAKFALYHEVGHILDEDLQSLKNRANEIILSIAKSLIKYNIDLKNLYSKNLPLEIEESFLEFKKIIVDRELKAWNIGYSISDISSDYEKYLFDKMKEYALATYNYGNFKNFVIENKVEKYIKNI